LESLILAQD